MENCRWCGRSPEQCRCRWRQGPDTYPCKACGFRGVQREMTRVDDVRGFVSHWLCRNPADCEARVVMGALASAAATVKDQ